LAVKPSVAPGYMLPAPWKFAVVNSECMYSMQSWKGKTTVEDWSGTSEGADGERCQGKGDKLRSRTL